MIATATLEWNEVWEALKPPEKDIIWLAWQRGAKVITEAWECIKEIFENLARAMKETARAFYEALPPRTRWKMRLNRRQMLHAKAKGQIERRLVPK